MAVSVEVATLFLRELAARGVPVRVRADGVYEVRQGGGVNAVSLENVSKEFERDRDPDRVKRFVESILTAPVLPRWPDARKGLYFAVEPADHDFGDTVREPVSDSAFRILVHLNEQGNQLMWVSDSLLSHWGQTRAAVEEAAAQNVSELLERAPLELTEMDGRTFGTFGINSPFKAALPWAPNFRAVVGAKLGWPLYALIPSRDFVYVFAEKDQPLLGVLGRAAVEEFEKGAYPVSRDVFRVSDEGVAAVFELQVVPRPGGGEKEEESEDLKTVRFQGGAVTFRIPAFWEEEYEEEEDGGDFYDPDEDTGTLRLGLRTFRFEGPIDADRVARMLQGKAEENGVAVERLPDGNALVFYPHDFEEDGVDHRMWVWAIGNPVLPNFARLALFTYTVRADQVEDGEIVELLGLLDGELRRARFAPHLGQ
jgi:hypothetical protein